MEEDRGELVQKQVNMEGRAGLVGTRWAGCWPLGMGGAGNRETRIVENKKRVQV